MSLFRSRAGVGLALGGLAVAAAAGLVPGAHAATTTTTSYSSDCFAQLLKLSLGGTEIPLDTGRGCDDPGDSFFPTDTIAGPAEFPFVINVLYESTDRSADQSQARARAGVAHVFLPLSVPSGGQLPDITLDVLTSESTCHNGTADSSSHVVGLNVGGEAVELPGDITGSPIDLSPLALVELNKQVVSSSTSDTGAGTNPRVQRTTNGVTQTALHVVVLPGAAPGPADVVDLAIASTSASCTKTVTTTTTDNPPPPPPSDVVGWMSGGGQLNANLTHSLTLPCTKTQAHPKPKLNVETPNGRFTLDGLDSVSCTMDSNQGSPEQPDAGFNTLTGSGKGSCNGKKNVPVSFRFTDEGEPNKGADEASITIGGNACPVNATGTVNGNQQAHRSNNPPA